jgi:hypothetical protein
VQTLRQSDPQGVLLLPLLRQESLKAISKLHLTSNGCVAIYIKGNRGKMPLPQTLLEIQNRLLNYG